MTRDVRAFPLILTAVCAIAIAADLHRGGVIDLNAVLNLVNPRGRPGRTFGKVALKPGTDVAAENDLSAAVDLHGNPRCIQLSAAAQRLLNFFSDFGKPELNGRVDPDHVGNTRTPAEIADGCRGICLLELHDGPRRSASRYLLDLDADPIC